ncbi:MAG: PTS sugar transporter subunit IIC [Myxococcaceae bacterium]
MAAEPIPSSNARVAAAQKRLQKIGTFFATQRHLIAVRDGVVGALPLVLVGSVFLLLSQAPWMESAALKDYVPVLLVPYRMLGGVIAVYVTFAAANSLAKSYALDGMACGLLAIAAYFIAAFPMPALVVDPALPPAGPPSIPVVRLGAGGIFAGLLLAVFSVEVTKLFVRRKWTIRMPPTAPESVVRSFIALLPTFAVVTSVFLVTQLFRFDLIALIENAAKPVLSATGSLPSAIGIVSVDSGLWVLGVHASAALATLRPFWEAMLLQNADAVVAKLPLPHIAPQPFFNWFVWQGGSGATLALAFHLLRAKSAQLRTVGRAGIVPALFNVNEPIVFGAPVVLNATLAIPFFLVPLVSAITAYSAIYLDLVARPRVEVLWVLPAPIGAFLATGGDWRAVALQMFNLAIGFLIYAPFVRRYDRRLLEQEAAVKASAAPEAALPPKAQTP